MVKPYQRIDTTADVGLISTGETLSQVFINMAKGFFSLITPLPRIRKRVCQRVRIHNGSKEDLLIAWLNELIFIFDTQNLLFRYFDITTLEDGQLEAVCFGEPIDPQRHILKLEVKAATYHQASIQMDANGIWHARVILDV